MKDLVTRAAARGSLAVVGMAKNSGKTVTINYLLAAACQLGVKVGLTSTGLDGETTDSISLLPKPAIVLPEGAMVATARSSLNRGTARLELLTDTGLVNPLGEIVIARVRQKGTVEVSGPERAEDLKQVIASMMKQTDLVLVDGALDRIASSAPAVTGGAVLATGAVVAPNLEGVARATVHQARLLLLPPIAGLTQEQAQVVERGRIAVQTGEQLVLLPLDTAIDGPTQVLDYISPQCRLLLGGAFTEDLARVLLGAARQLDGFELAVRDGTRIFVGQRLWRQLERAKVLVGVVQPVNLMAVSVNPVDPRGRQLPGHQLVTMLEEMLPDLYIFNPLAGGWTT